MEGNARRVTVMSVETKIASMRPNQTCAAIVVPSAICEIFILVFSKFYPSAIAPFSMCQTQICLPFQEKFQAWNEAVTVTAFMASAIFHLAVIWVPKMSVIATVKVTSEVRPEITPITFRSIKWIDGVTGKRLCLSSAHKATFYGDVTIRC